MLDAPTTLFVSGKSPPLISPKYFLIKYNKNTFILFIRVMQSKIDFSGRVAVITGAGGGLGKEYALFLAKNGASVVVNDLGGSVHGTGASSKPADLVVDQIRSLGGSAVADYHNVSKDGDKIIKNAIDTFGRVDILINNAG